MLILLSLDSKAVKRRKVFKFETFWLEDEEYKETIDSIWHNPPIKNEGLMEDAEKQNYYKKMVNLLGHTS